MPLQSFYWMGDPAFEVCLTYTRRAWYTVFLWPIGSFSVVHFVLCRLVPYFCFDCPRLKLVLHHCIYNVWTALKHTPRDSLLGHPVWAVKDNVYFVFKKTLFAWTSTAVSLRVVWCTDLSNLPTHYNSTDILVIVDRYLIGFIKIQAYIVKPSSTNIFFLLTWIM